MFQWICSILEWIEGHPGTASWLQAIGTLIALGIAIAIPWLQHRAEKRREREQRESRNNGLAHMIEAIVMEIKSGITRAKEKPQDYFLKTDNRNEIENLIQELDRLPPGIVEPHLGPDFALFRTEARRTINIINRMDSDHRRFGPDDIRPMDNEEKIMLENFQDLADFLLSDLTVTGVKKSN